MKRIATTLLLSVCMAGGMQAQSLKQLGTSVDDIVPQGWSHYEVTGDLNKDGQPDLAVMATPNFKERIVTRDDGYERNCNQPVFAVYFATADGKLKQWKQYGEVLPADDIDNEFCSWNVNLDITERSVLNISVQPECSAGSYFTNIDRYSYRFQNGDFYLIGKDVEEASRNTGEIKTVSENYLTWKRQVVKDNMFDDDVQPTEKWSSLPRTRLKKLGGEI